MKLSIIMPCFNAQDTLLDAVNSIREQNLIIDYEVIIVDDGSSDTTREMIKKIAQENIRVKYIFHEKNLGGGAARNTAVKNSSGDLIFCLDSDDILPNEMLPKMIKFLEEKKVDGVVIGKSIFFIEDTKTVEFEVYYDEKRLNFKDFFTPKPISITGNFLYTRAAFDKIGGYPILHGFDTQGFGFRFLANNLKAEVMKDAFYFQRLPKSDSYYIREVRAGNISKNWFYIYLDNLYKFNEAAKDLIVNYPYLNFDWNNSEINLPNELKKRSTILSDRMLDIDYQQAEKALSDSQDKYDHLWLAGRGLNLKNHQLSTEHLKRAQELGCHQWPLLQIALAPLYTTGSFAYEMGLFNQLDFFSKRQRNQTEKIKSLISRIKNKIKRMIGLKNE